MQQKWLFVITPKTKLIDLNLKEVWQYSNKFFINFIFFINNISIDMRYDLFYIKEQCILLDFKIIIRTITTVLFFKGQ